LFRLVGLTPLGIPAKSQIIDCCQQLSHGYVELSYNVNALTEE
jgi:hypothetical protein